MAQASSERTDGLPHRLWESRRDQEDLRQRVNALKTQLKAERAAKDSAIRERYEDQEETTRLGNVTNSQAGEIINLRQLLEDALVYKKESPEKIEGDGASALKVEIALQETQIQLAKVLSQVGILEADLVVTKTENIGLARKYSGLLIENSALKADNIGLMGQVKSLVTRVNRLKTTEGNYLIATGRAPFGMVLREFFCAIPGIGPVFERAMSNVYDRVKGTKNST